MSTTKRLSLIFTSLLMLVGCNPHTFFYYPNRKLYIDPEKVGMKYELLNYPSLNGKKLYGLLFQTEQEPKGIIVHFHGNFGNVSNHLLESHFLTKYGFDVLIFDYQGFGGSEGKPTPKRTIEDGIATVRLAQEKNRNKEAGVGIFGQSLGGAVGTVVAAKEPLVKAALIEASFTSYRSIARAVLKRSAFTWILYPFYPFFLSWSYDPIRHVDKISPKPVFFIHGDKDSVIPYQMSQKLFEKAKEPKKIWIIPNTGHLQCRRNEGNNYEKQVADFFTDALRAVQK